jgi:hypothetical protein
MDVLPDDAFKAYIDRYRLAGKLTELHWQRVLIGGLGAMMALGYNLWRAPGQDSGLGLVVVGVVTVFLVACVIAMVATHRRLHRRLREPGATARLQALAVADCVNGMGNCLLVLAAVGDVLLLIATIFKTRIGLTLGGEALLVVLIPTALLVLHGLTRIPSDRLLIALHRRGAGGG